jgi:SAM-dependent methyltransferase
MVKRVSGTPLFRRIKQLVLWSFVVATAAIVGIAVLEFPYAVDAPITEHEAEKLRNYYAEAYRQPDTPGGAASAYETKYIQMATSAAKNYRIKEQVEALVDRYSLRDRAVLEIGSGRGYLQDVVRDYTGLDISPTVRRFYHKKFVLGSATALPFPDNSFDGAWSVWVWEHIPNPEQALRECRRVVRDGGVILLQPAWNCTSWAANGARVRPYSELDVTGKLMKAVAPIRFSTFYSVAERLPARFIRTVTAIGGPTQLHYKRLVPNYKEYWEADSDAVNSLDRHEMMLWFQTRGDACLNCDGAAGSLLMRGEPWLIIRVNKRS